jgi:hypothetical protein
MTIDGDRRKVTIEVLGCRGGAGSGALNRGGDRVSCTGDIRKGTRWEAAGLRAGSSRENDLHAELAALALQ